MPKPAEHRPRPDVRDLLPDVTDDERGPESADERPVSEDALLQRYLDERPPHHGD
ncbi:MAG: hypothetical protein ACTHNT_06315 [Actinomycetales bacterium]